MPLTGGCVCGAIRNAISREPIDVYARHCADCRAGHASGDADTNLLACARERLLTAAINGREGCRDRIADDRPHPTEGCVFP